MQKKYHVTWILILLLCTFGCTAKNISVKTDDIDVKKAEVKLAESAQSINESLQELAAIQRTVHPAPKVANPLDADAAGMAQVTSIDWTGPVAALLDKIAKIAHYRVRILGKAPAIPIIVSITAKNVELADILRDANFQCGQQANIAVYAAQRVIELRYAKS